MSLQGIINLFPCAPFTYLRTNKAGWWWRIVGDSKNWLKRLTAYEILSNCSSLEWKLTWQQAALLYLVEDEEHIFFDKDCWDRAISKPRKSLSWKRPLRLNFTSNKSFIWLISRLFTYFLLAPNHPHSKELQRSSTL